MSGVGLHQSPQTALSFGAREAVLLPARPDLADLPIYEAPVIAPPPSVVGPPRDVETSASMRALHNAERVERAKLAPAVQKIIPV